MASASALLSLYVTVDTTRALLVYAALHSGVELAPSALTFGAEVLKLAIAVGGVLITTPSGQPRFTIQNSPNLRPYFRFAIPAVLYGVNNILYLTGLKISSPALLQVCVLSKLPLTAFLHHVVIKRRRSRPMWISLGILSIGLVLAGSPEAFWDASQATAINFGDLISGPVIGLTVGIVSACSSVYTELALKEQIGFWQAQTYLYFWGAVFAGLAALISSARSSQSIDTSSTIASLPAFSLVVVVTALTGLVVALILRQRDNLVKLVGSSLCITTVFILQHVFFPGTDGLDFRTTFGIGVLTLSTWTYNHYKEIGDDSNATNSTPQEYVELTTSEHSSPLASKDSLAPDTPSSSFSASSPIPLSPPPSPDCYTPTPARLAVAAALLLVISSLTSLQGSSTTNEEKRTLQDLREYFNARGLRASSWTRAGQNDHGNCIEQSRRQSMEEEWTSDPNLVMAKAGCPTYPLPDEGLITHLFWSGERWRTPAFSLVTDSWLATQDTIKSKNRLMWWYETIPPPISFVEQYTSPTSPYRSIVSFRMFNESLADSTSCLHEMTEWRDLDYRKQVEMPSMTRKDLIRGLLLEKFGGIWLDVDTIVLKDLAEVVRAGPGIVTENEVVDNSLVVSGPLWGGAGHRMLETACQLPFGTAALVEKFPGLRLKAGPASLYSEGVVRLCAQQECGLSSLPTSMILVPSTLSPCQTDSSSSLSHEYLSSRYIWAPEMLARYDDDSCWDEGGKTLISQVRNRVNEVLNEKIGADDGLLVNHGGSLFSRTRRKNTDETER